ncbi:hypothetical protein KNO81_37665 [Paraburkholderia sediminicola]|nr:hypothetical protein [Paraburkholderia sediminicola]
MSLSMPAVQTCIGLYGVHTSGDWLIVAHFDTDLALAQNLDDLRHAMPAGHTIRDYTVTLFGGDGKASLLRCARPSAYIGESLQIMLAGLGCQSTYSGYYSGLVPRTYNFQYEAGRPAIVEGQRADMFGGCHLAARRIAQMRMRSRPDAYSPTQARLTDVSAMTT